MQRRCFTLFSPKRPTVAQMRVLEGKLLSLYRESGCQLASLSPLVTQLEASRDADACLRPLLFPEERQMEAQKRKREKGAEREGVMHKRTAYLSSSSLSAPLAKTEESEDTMSFSQALVELDKQRYDARKVGEFWKFRNITVRNITMVDADSKNTRVLESDFLLVKREILALWKNDVPAALQGIAACLSNPSRKTDGSSIEADQAIPDEVIFLVAFSETTSWEAVSSSLQTVAFRVKSLIEEQQGNPKRLFPCERVLCVLPVFIGVDVPSGIEVNADSSGKKSDAEAISPPDFLCFPRGGIYTTDAVLHCIRSLPQLTVPVTQHQGTSRKPRRHVRRKVLVLSDAYMHPRLLADMHGRTKGIKGDDTFSVEVFPGIFSDALSPKEEEAFARYALCQLFPRGEGQIRQLGSETTL